MKYDSTGFQALGFGVCGFMGATALASHGAGWSWVGGIVGGVLGVLAVTVWESNR